MGMLRKLRHAAAITKRRRYYSAGEAFTPDTDTFDTEAFDAYSIPVAVALRDSFTGAAGLLTAHSPETGGAWSLHPVQSAGGVASLSGNGTVYNSAAPNLDNWFLSATSALSESYEVAYKLKIYTTIFASAVYCGVVMDVNAAASTGYVIIFVPTGANTGNWVVQRVLTGTATNLTPIAGNTTGISYADGTELDVRCQLDRRYVGNAGVNEDVVYLRVWVNGVKVGEWKDTNATVLPSTKRTALKFVRVATTSTGHHISGVSIQDISEAEIVSDTVRISPNTVEQQIMIRAFGTAWDVHQPVFLVDGATKVSQTVVNYNRATLILTTGASTGLITITDPTTGSKVRLSIADNVSAPMLSGWSQRKQLKVTGSTEGIGVQSNFPIPIRIHTGSGTDTTTDVYIGGNHRADWGDVRITDRSGQTRLPFTIIRKEATYIDVVFWTPIINYSEHTFFLYWGKTASSGSVYKIASITDQHYDTGGAAPDNRQQTLTFIDNFVARMATYLPDLAVSCGDKTGATSSVEATQLAWYQAVLDHFAPVSAHATYVMDGVSPGNHDFEYPSFANIKAKHAAETWMETGLLYGAKDVGDYIFVSLDSNYNDTNDTHLSIQHNGYGYIDAAQLAWLSSTLAAATKPVIIDCHHPLCEIDSEQFTLTKEIYHTKNREKVRKVIEDSGKVIAVKHGHVHFDRIDVINGIPYIITGNLTNTGGFGETPATNVGNWTLLELDSDARIIVVKREAQIGSDYETIYETVVPFGETSFSEDVANDPYKTFALAYKGTFEKSSILRNATETYVTDDTYLYKFPPNRATPEPYLSDGTIKIQGRTNTPNFGRTYWNFTQQQGKFKVEFDVLLKNTSTLGFKIGGDAVQATPGAYLIFNASGEITAYNNLVVTSLRTYTVDTWYKVVMIIDVTTDRYSIYIDDVLEASTFVFYNANTFTFMRALEIVTETGVYYVNNLRISKAVSPEPTLAVV